MDTKQYVIFDIVNNRYCFDTVGSTVLEVAQKAEKLLDIPVLGDMDKTKYRLVTLSASNMSLVSNNRLPREEYKGSCANLAKNIKLGNAVEAGEGIMTPEQFVYWLQGFCELHQLPPNALQWESIRSHLALVFDKRTPEVKLEDYTNKLDDIAELTIKEFKEHLQKQKASTSLLVC